MTHTCYVIYSYVSPWLTHTCHARDSYVSLRRQPRSELANKQLAYLSTRLSRQLQHHHFHPTNHSSTRKLVYLSTPSKLISKVNT